MATISDSELLALLANDTPDKPSLAGWVVDYNELHKATQQVGFVYPVKVKYHGKCKYRYGSHRIDYVNGKLMHIIVLNPRLPAQQANKTFWHELRHGMQLEAAIKHGFVDLSAKTHPQRQFSKLYDAQKGEHGNSYLGNAYELDAQSFAQRMEQWKIIS